MTAVRDSGTRNGTHGDTVTILDDGDLDDVVRTLDADPFVTAVVAARIAEAGSLRFDRLGGYLLGIRSDDGLDALCFAGGNVVPIAGDAVSCHRFGAFLAGRPRLCSSVVGRAEAVAAVWLPLERRWGLPRATRARQPLLVLDGPALGDRHGDLRVVLPRHLDRYAAAATVMFTEELGVSPHVAPGTNAFYARLHGLVSSGRAFGIFDFRGQVVFKAEIGAVTARTAQIQGVWVRPDLRGRGIGTAALATVFDHALGLAPTVSLYVNDFNTAALRVYERLGMRRSAVLRTVLID